MESLTPKLILPATTLFPPYASRVIPPGPYTACYGTVANGVSANQQTLIHNVAVGDALVVAAQSNNISTAAVSVSDSQNNSYQLVSFSVNRSPNLALFVCFVTTPMTAGVDSITVTHGGTATVKTMIVRGSPGFVCVDTVAIPADGSSISPSNSLPALGAVGDWVVSGLSNAAAPGMPVSWSGSIQTVSAGPGPFLTTADQITTSTVPQTISATMASSGTWELQIVALSPVPLVNQQVPLIVPPGINSPNSVNLVVPYVSFPGANVGGNLANVTVFGQSDNTVSELIDGTGAVANVAVVAPAGTVFTGTSAPAVPFAVQFPFDPLVPSSLQFNNSLIALRVQYPTALPDVFVPGNAANVNVSGQADNSVPQALAGSAGNINVTAPAGTVQVFQTFAPQFSFPAILPKTIQFNPVFSALRVQFNTALPDVFVPGATANVSVATPAGTVTALIDGVGQVANVSAVAPAGSLSITTSTPPQYPVSTILPGSLKFIPAYLGLRPQYSTALPDVFVAGSTANVNVSGQSDNTITEAVPGVTANVNVSAPAGSLSVTTITPPQYPFTPLLPNSIRFNPAYADLRVQYNTGTPVVLGGIGGSVANVNVSGQPDNSLLETITGSVANVTVAAPSGSINIYQNFNSPFPDLPVLPSSLRFNPAYSGLRVQYNTGLPGVFVPGTAGQVNVSAPAGTITIIVGGTDSDNAVAAQAGTVSELVLGSAANVSVGAISGNISISISGATGLVNTVAIPGSPGSGASSIAGVTCAVIVTAYPGDHILTDFFNPNWWRVYKDYGLAPTW